MHIVFAKNFRGFSYLEVDLSKVNFLVGDNSSGKSSILHLISAVTRGDLYDPPSLDEDFGVGQYDYFSPYFEYKDVTFGFTKSQDGNFFCKIVTVKRVKNAPPVMVSCSYFTNDTFIKFHQSGKRIFYSVRKDKSLDSIKSCIDAHEANEKSKIAENISIFAIGHPTYLLSSIDYKRLNLHEEVKIILSSQLPGSRLISPIRALPEPFYDFRRAINPQGKHFATMWMDFVNRNAQRETEDIRVFGQESGLFEDIEVKPISKSVSGSPLIVTVTKSGKKFTLNQVGVGVSQVVPVLIESLYSLINNPHIMLVQQPELHLHPVAQAALGSYFYKASCMGLRGILETHSSFFIDRFRADVRDNASEGDGSFDFQDFRIIFCENTKSGNTAKNISIASDGSFISAPDSYHRFFIDELLRTML